ncbi:hypothetical protein M011DRAFT_496832 [Sporormia fimetaria CBS 119925]|uniref:Uncharacterized protein n=1 Tax=Sporormia fimetaria CBS 119925 TaxID=1340428 RepID=A0A6A6V2J4_9PLEO|nr:hypothetical protein M011DRAFT_496832 [Sporormia fimetaria CBS 119925]
MGSRPGGSHDKLHGHNDLRPRPQLPASASAPAGRLPRLLPADLSQYTDAYLPTAAIPTSSTSLAELAHLIRLQSYQEQRKAHARVRLHRWLVSSALSARLVHCGELAHRTLVDNFRSDDKRSFAALYNAFNDVRNSCDATRRYALLEPDLDLAKPKSLKHDKVQSFSTFISEVPTKVVDDLLAFISEVRTKPDFLATRIMNLSQQELASLMSFRQALDPIESVMAMQARGKALGSAQKPNQGSGLSPVERLLSFQRHDPLSTLVYTIFANSSGPDSAEDLRRTDVFATTCAKLIMENKQGDGKFIRTILDVWAGMREWPGKANLELYLMQVLQDGQFLLEKAEERTGSQPVQRSTKDTIAADDFFDKSVKRLFEVVDDEPSAGGIPEGVLEIGNAIIRKFDEAKLRKGAQNFFTHGIMMGYHISEHARQKILKEIAIRAQKLVLDMTYNWKQQVPILPEIRTHIENILARFKPTKSHAKPVLLPAKAITSPRETVEVQPFIVVCPSDIITLVHTLFPERRPPSSHNEKDSIRRTALGSSASSLSGVSIMPFRPNTSSAGDASSILSASASSITSDTMSQNPLLETIQPITLPLPEPYSEKIAPTEAYGRGLRMACAEMSRILGVDATSGSCHPCAERWAVLYISPDGKQLKTRMRKDFDDEDDHDDDSPENDSSDDDGPADRIDLENDYHSLKEAIAKLVEEYEIPKELAPESESKSFSNRTSTHRRGARSGGITRQQSEGLLGSRNPYNNQSQSQLTSLITSQRNAPIRHRSPQHPRSNSNPQSLDKQENASVLVTMLEAAMQQCQARSDFVNAHLYFKTLQTLKKLTSPSLTKNGYAALLHYFSRGPRDSLGKSANAIEEFEAWFVWLKQSQERHDAVVEDMIQAFKNLRDKMWYITDVRNSANYEEAKNVAAALKLMGQPTKTLDGKPIQTPRPRNYSKSSSNNFLLKTEAQVVDIMAAPAEFGGPNKLSDDQSDMTMKWLIDYGVENFCKGEERIHRFCLEVDKCVNKLVGDGMMDSPVLWSSELYRRDKEILDSGRQKGDLFLTGVGTLSIAGDEEYETQTRTAPRNLDFAQRPSQGSLRSVSHRNGSQQSFDTSPWARAGDTSDYYAASSPVLSIDPTATFWSPFQTQAQSPTSATSIRPRTASSSKGTVMLKQSASVNEDKRRFLLDLKQTLTGLLLSDLGTNVFGSGSETDAWFRGDLGEDCLQRREDEERRRKRLQVRHRSMRTLRSAARQEHRNGPLDTLGRPERSQVAPPVATLQHAATSDAHLSAGEHSSTSSDATSRSSGMAVAKKAGLLEFPYNVAFRRLLNRFATHPNPFSKLHALYELELLIVASLSSRSSRQYNNRRDTLPAVPQSPTLGAMPELSSREPATQTARANNLEEAIANCEERRSHTMSQDRGSNASPQPHRAGARSPTGPPSTDMIVEVIQGLFRDAEIRPKTLFRDLQYIASFVPAQMLDKTARGKAFWDVSLAALGLKQDVCRIMVEIVDDIVAQNAKARDPVFQQQAQQTAAAASRTSMDSASAGGASGTPSEVSFTPPPPTSRYTMQDAARMLLITAKEGDAVAERELAIFYLTSPELVQRTILPLTKPRDVFKTELLKSERKANMDPARGDPMTMCVAQHWMEQSRKGGDVLATKYLRARVELESIS